MGKYVIPSISFDDPAFPDQYYWRGSIWGLTNYMVYHGLKRYQFDDVSFQFAQKSYDLFMEDWRAHQHNNEQYLATGGAGKGDPHYTFGALLPLLAIEEFIDMNPWDGLRFGILNPTTAGEFQGALWGKQRYNVVVGPQKTALTRDGQLRFEAEGGVVVRQYRPESSRLSFSLIANQSTSIHSLEFPSGEFQLKVDGKVVGKVKASGGRIRFEVQPGNHQIELNQN
ncbi:MAG: hypothetical protein U0V70_20120 [Terriglobia bacterium]